MDGGRPEGFKPWLRLAVWAVGALFVVWAMFGCSGAYRCQRSADEALRGADGAWAAAAWCVR